MTDNSFLLDCFTSSCIDLFQFNTITREIHYYKSDYPYLLNKDRMHLSELKALLYENNAVEYSFFAKIDQYINNGVFKKIFASKQSKTLNTYRRMTPEGLKWTRSNIAIPSCFSSANPEVLFYTTDVSEEESAILDIDLALACSYFSIIKINLKTNTFSKFVDPAVDSYDMIKYDKNDYTGFIQTVCEQVIFEEDRNLFLSNCDTSNLQEYFSIETEQKSFFFRRRVGGIYRWLKTTIFPTIDYSDSNPTVLLTTTNVNNDALRYIYLASRYQYSTALERDKVGISENFYSDMLNLLEVLTKQYKSILTIDLDSDSYMSFKVTNIFHNEYRKQNDSFTSTLETYMEKNFPKDHPMYDALLQFSQIDNIKKELTHKVSMSIKYTLNNETFICTITRMQGTELPKRVILTIIRDMSPANCLKVKTFGPFEVFDQEGKQLKFEKRASKEVLAMLVDRRGFPVSIDDVIVDILEKDPTELNNRKYASGLIRKCIKDLENAGYAGVIVESNHLYHINMNKIDCDYYHLLDGDNTQWSQYHNEYMTNYSWAEETNAELLNRLSL